MEILKSTTKVARVRGRTSTQEILGGSTPNLRVHRKWAEQRRQLTALREEFSGTRDRQTYSAKEVVALSGEHMADAATDSYDRDCALALLSSAQNALYEIEQALNRIDNGTYGVCELTGESIEAERLKAIPWTRYSAVAQARLEARGLGNRVQLGELGSWSNTSDSPESPEDAEDALAPQAEREAA